MCERLATRIPGVQVAVAVSGKLVWSEGFGYADAERKRPVTRETQFRIGSVSKPLTAAAVALLYQQGKLDLDAPVQRYVPSFPDKGYPITTRQLAGHLAGIRHYKDREFFLNRRFATVLDGLTIFQDDSLLFPPGTRFSYSSYAWNLISAVVEGASGDDFLHYMSAHVLRPLGLAHTAPDRTDSLIPGRTQPYDRDSGGSYRIAPAVDNSYKWAGGGFVSTAEDLVSEVFFDVWRQADRFESRSQVSTWLMAIARNKALSVLRRRTTEELDEEVAEFIEDPADNPEVTMHKTQRSAILQDCLAQLSPAHREIVDLVYYHEKTIDEVAEIIGVPQNTVKTRMFYARKRIGELMAAKGIDRAWM